MSAPTSAQRLRSITGDMMASGAIEEKLLALFRGACDPASSEEEARTKAVMLVRLAKRHERALFVANEERCIAWRLRSSKPSTALRSLLHPPRRATKTCPPRASVPLPPFTSNTRRTTSGRGSTYIATSARDVPERSSPFLARRPSHTPPAPVPNAP